ncbi:hypothetical protein GMES_4174 [Paraglaciecola mesophila KMM 241]|uniref:Uncharacterized protein n=1 Tax=Paraglaciecola mesophila KMM 241 TaxID=1128912 RepID=K6Z7U7_9ALTE|nr:hypothetical protein GMES_4174 [Paraglaciecola mesophila KMM 241]
MIFVKKVMFDVSRLKRWLIYQFFNDFAALATKIVTQNKIGKKRS